jgi:hypothetical protein
MLKDKRTASLEEAVLYIEYFSATYEATCVVGSVDVVGSVVVVVVVGDTAVNLVISSFTALISLVMLVFAVEINE